MSTRRDPEVERLRELISEVDRSILDAVNRRLELVAELRRYKDANGIAFLDPDREASMLDERVRENAGPLSDDGVRALQTELLALTKRELGAG
jgi:3-deoxy-7-phosphoheptulonate synthase/chorismate mutase